MIWQGGGIDQNAVGRPDLLHVPARLLGRRGEDIFRQPRRGLLVDLTAEGRHLARGTSLEDRVYGLLRLEPAQGLRDQCRADAAQTVGAVAL